MTTVDTREKSYAVELFVLSMLSLFMELVIIRWLSCDVRAFTIFRTFPLVSCFIGLGLGFVIGKDKIFNGAILSVLLLVFAIKMSEVSGINLLGFISSDSWGFQNVNVASADPTICLLLYVTLLLLLAGPFLLFVGIGCRLSNLFQTMPAAKAYLINLAGSLVGSLSFSLSNGSAMPPSLLLAIPSGLLLISSVPVRLPERIVQIVALVLICLVPLWPVADKSHGFTEGMRQSQEPPMNLWSPYHRIDLRLINNKETSKFFGLELDVNHNHQQFFFLDDPIPEGLPDPVKSFVIERRIKYGMPFKLTKADEVLIVGAGTGQNISLGLNTGSNRIDAVDIDPVTLAVGKKHNPAYSSEKVTAICDDARHFLRTHSDRRYDLIIFPILDSQTVVGQGSSVRTDSYVYTKESIEEALKLLKPSGVLTLTFGVFEHKWLTDRLYRTIEEAAGYPPLLIHRKTDGWVGGGSTFILSDSVKNKTFQIPDGWEEEKRNAIPGNRPLTDDWPFLYLAPNNLDIPYLAFCGIIVAGAFAVSRRFIKTKPVAADWQMFFLGAGFLLMELHAISALSLIYGSTWITASMVINGILCMICAASFLVLKFPAFLFERLKLAYAGLLLCILVSYAFPSTRILAMVPDAIGPAVVTVVVLLPLFFAGIIFPSCFSKSKDVSRAMAFNLLGSVLGGLLEYSSNFVGISGLQFIALMLYALSFAFFLPMKKALENA